MDLSVSHDRKKGCLERQETYVVEPEVVRGQALGQVPLNTSLLASQEMSHFQVSECLALLER